jgi:hypothetical protein
VEHGWAGRGPTIPEISGDKHESLLSNREEGSVPVVIERIAVVELGRRPNNKMRGSCDVNVPAVLATNGAARIADDCLDRRGSAVHGLQ